MRHIAAALLVVSICAAAYGDDQRVTSTSLHYLGAFKLPHENGAKQPIFSWGQRGMSFDSSGDPGGVDDLPGSLWLTGHDHAQEVFEIAIPVPAATRDYRSLPAATLLSPAFEFTAGCKGGKKRLGGLEVHGDRIWASCADWYNVSGRTQSDVLWSRNRDLSQLEGPFHAGALNDKRFHSNRQGAYIFSIPQAFADTHFDGRSLVTGFSRNSHGGQLGPTLLAFDPDNPADALAVVYYRQPGGGDCGDDCDFPLYTPCDNWLGATWIDDGEGQAILIAGRKYYGPVSYSGGWHCDPGFGEVIFYDPQDLVARVSRELKHWQVIPYEFWRPEELWNEGGELGGLAFDPRNRILYMVERKGGGNGRAIIHVFKAARSTTPAPAQP